MRVIGTLGGLYPKKGDEWQYHMHRYSLLNPAQKGSYSAVPCGTSQGSPA
jgi:hypothetical protein